MSIEKITVSDIVKTADTGRQSFYNHFHDKYELMTWIFDHQSDEIVSRFNYEDEWFKIIESYYRSFTEAKDFYVQASCIVGQNSLSEHLYNEAYTFHRDMVKRFSGENELTDEQLFAVRYNSYGAIGMCLLWMQNGMKESPAHMAHRLVACLPPPIRRYFKI